MKMSGASPEFRAVCSLPSMSSFWIDWTSIVTPGFAASKSATVLSQYSLPGPVVELCQKVIETSPPSAASRPRRRRHPRRNRSASMAMLAPNAAMAAPRVFLIIVEPQVFVDGRCAARLRDLGPACQSLSITF